MEIDNLAQRLENFKQSLSVLINEERCRKYYRLKKRFIWNEKAQKFSYIVRNSRKTVITSVDECLDVLRHYHDIKGCHQGINNTFISVKAHYYWPRIYKDVYNYVSNCSICRKIPKASNDKNKAKTIKVQNPLEVVGMDLIDMATVSESGNKYLLSLTDYFTQFVEFFPLKDNTVKSVTSALKSYVYRWGSPEQVVYIQGNDLVSQIDEIMKMKFNIVLNLSSGYHAECIKLIDKTKEVLKKHLDTLCPNMEEWDEYIEEIAYTMRISKHSETNFSPYYLMFDREPNALQVVENKEDILDLELDEEKEIDQDDDMDDKSISNKSEDWTLRKVQNNERVKTVDASSHLMDHDYAMKEDKAESTETFASYDHFDRKRRIPDIIRDSESLCDSITNKEKLTDVHIDQCHAILARWFLHVDGMQSCSVYYSSNLECAYVPEKKFIQILSYNNNHWVCVSNMHCKEKEILIYDSLFKTIPRDSINFKEAIFHLCKSPNVLNVKWANIALQDDSNDSGLYAIANATALCYGLQPQHIAWCPMKLRPSLIDALTKSKIELFPIKELIEVKSLISKEEAVVYRSIFN